MPQIAQSSRVAGWLAGWLAGWPGGSVRQSTCAAALLPAHPAALPACVHVLQVNTDPFGEGWMIKVKLSNPAELDALMAPEAYEKHCESGGH